MSSLIFTVKRCQPELVAPAIPTPHEIKPLSDIDDQEGLRFHIPMIQIYRSVADKDPVKVIRQALAQTLVFYYPFAGRLREGPNGKLMVDCTGEGVMFIEADADVKLDEFGDGDLQPPFPCFKELLYDVPGSQDITNTPLLLIQVTRLKCGSFILALRLNHTMSDAAGLVQLMKAWGEMARGARKPSIVPVWCRELLMARERPRITCKHSEFVEFVETEMEEGSIMTLDDDDMILRSFLFGANEIAAIRRLVPNNCGIFDVIAACIWRCRTKALKIDADDDVSIMVAVNARTRFNPPLPVGYYGNAIAYPAAVTTAGKLCGNPIGYAVELINKLKSQVTEEYMHSVADLLSIKGYIPRMVRSFTVSDLRGFNPRRIDFGWGDAVYGGPSQGGLGPFPGVTFLTPITNSKGQESLLLPIWLPSQAMNTFAKELDAIFSFISSLL